MEVKTYAEYYLYSPHKRAKDFRNDTDYKTILQLALSGPIKTIDVYQNTNAAEGKNERGRVIGTKLKNLVQWGFLIKTGDMDPIYRQESFLLNERLRKEIRHLVEG